jgi:hypothetical protein
MNRKLDLSALIEAHRSVTAPSVEDRERNRAKIAASIGSGVVVGAALLPTRPAAAALSSGAASGSGAAAATSSALASGLAKWVAVSVLIAAGGGVGFHSARHRFAGTSTASPPPAEVATPASRVVPAALALPDALADTATEAAPADTDTAAAPNARGPRATPSLGGIGAPTDTSFGRALELLRAARRSLDGESPAAALALLDRYAVEFPRGSALQPEYEATRVLALCAAGRTEAGERARDSFLEKQSASPLAERVRTACGRR